jgi:type II secretory pathway component GspD/PulD (secretin)
MQFCTAEVVLVVLTMAGSVPGAQEASAPVGRCVSIEILLAASAGPIQAATSDAATPADTTADHIQALEKQGQLASLVRIRVATLENCVASVQFGERIPVAESRSTASRTRDGGGPVMTNFAMTNVGTMLNVTPRVAEDGAVILELEVEHSRLERRPSDADRASRENAEFVPPIVVTVTAKSTIRIPAGKTVISEARQTAPDMSRQTWILATATVIDTK